MKKEKVYCRDCKFLEGTYIPYCNYEERNPYNGGLLVTGSRNMNSKGNCKYFQEIKVIKKSKRIGLLKRLIKYIGGL
jgi:hypothetical protein